MIQEKRIKILQEKICEAGFSAALFFYSRDIFYYTGTARPSYLAVLPDDYRLFVMSDLDYAFKEVFIDKEKMKEEQRLENIYREFFSNLSKADMIIATEMDILTVEQLSTFREVFPSFEFVDVSPLVLE